MNPVQNIKWNYLFIFCLLVGYHPDCIKSEPNVYNLDQRPLFCNQIVEPDSMQGFFRMDSYLDSLDKSSNPSEQKRIIDFIVKHYNETSFNTIVDYAMKKNANSLNKVQLTLIWEIWFGNQDHKQIKNVKPTLIPLLINGVDNDSELNGNPDMPTVGILSLATLELLTGDEISELIVGNSNNMNILKKQLFDWWNTFKNQLYWNSNDGIFKIKRR